HASSAFHCPVHYRHLHSFPTRRSSDLTAYTRDLMSQLETDLGAKLDWVAVNHHNTGHPHVHVIVRGKDELGVNLVINGDYLANGDRKSTRLNSSHVKISYAVFCLKKKN